jgi:hypothetical protein
MDWESLYCPNRGCRYYGRPFLQGHLVKNGSSHGQKQARCKVCETPVSIRYETAYLDLHADPAIFEMAVRALDLLSAPLMIPLVCCHINSFRRASSCGEAMARRRKDERRTGIASRGI